MLLYCCCESYSGFEPCLQPNCLLIRHMVTLLLPSLDDGCFFKLKLNIKPACYYQEAITFSIDQTDLDEFFEPK